jgi:predicted acylesterase/phospholipase RssA
MQHKTFRTLRLVSPRLLGVLLLMGASLQGCQSLPRQEAVPRALTQKAVPVDFPNSRYWPELSIEHFVRDAAESTDRERANLALLGQTAPALPTASYLAISGGGDAGAFGAGLLVGWTKRGTRPEFKVVTGVSAGALIAPFAFLGSAYDPVLKNVSLSIGAKDIIHMRSLLAAVASDGMADATPLAAMIAHYVTPDVLVAISREYAKGRVLLIATTDLDSRQPVVWNMGAIASSKNPRAIDLFRKIMLASASIPGLFPPVMIDVSVNGNLYQEMHVDGGVMAEAFLFPPSLIRGLTANGSLYNRSRRLYIIRNGRMDAQWETVARRTTSVAHRALDALIDVKGFNDLYRLEMVAREDGEDFNIAYIGADFTDPHKTRFDPSYMRRLFIYSYELAATGDPWYKTLPGAPLTASE